VETTSASWPSRYPLGPLPVLTDENRFFWTSGADGRLRFLRCQACGYYIHPPLPRCPRCLGMKIHPEVASGRARVFSYTVNHHPWNPASPEPYVIGLVEIDEQIELRLTTNLIDVEPEDVRIGMPVRVSFQQVDQIYLPLFAPEAR
jgi:uncharacterized OB-fold protein